MSDSWRPRGLWPARLLCLWDSPGRNTGVGCHFLLQKMAYLSPNWLDPTSSLHQFISSFFYIRYKRFINSRSSWWATASTQTSSTQSQVQRSLRASHSDSKRVSTSPSRTGPFTFRMMERLVSSMNSTRTCVHCPCEPVLPNTLVTLASLMGCTRLVSMMAARRRSGGENQYIS